MGRPALCVYCRRHPVDPEWLPFCSERCKLRDLGQWLDGTYRVPGVPASAPSPSNDSEDDSD
jgi:endogenous inhibitor of DNA gyrase (YacG/DUF329 family)